MVKPSYVQHPVTANCQNREQLGGNKFLVSDGIFMAKALGRTFVEYPVKDARWVTVTVMVTASVG